jgi:pimeloyl-ACP methyl ester carboxylesterase
MCGKPLRRITYFALTIALGLPALWLSAAAANATAKSWVDTSPHKEGFVTANGITLEYLDWGGTGEVLILLHGSGDNPHVFDDLAPAFTDRFHVIAYARRGHGRSQARPPYDTATLTEDLRGLMDALGISRASLVGWSLGGNEITAMAALHPERVDKLVYLDAAYDWADPDYKAAFRAIPRILFDTPAAAMKSLDAYIAYEKASDYTQLDDIRRVEAYLRESVVVRQDGSVQPRIPEDVITALTAALWTNPPRDYRRVRSPALAIFAESMIDLHDADTKRREQGAAWERQYIAPFRVKSIARIRRELTNVQILAVPGAHDSFFLTSRAQVVQAMRQFLLGQRAPRRLLSTQGATGPSGRSAYE